MRRRTPSPSRRQALAVGLLGLASAARASTARSDHAALARALREGGCALLIRHAWTEAGIGDPPGFTLEDCRTQRQISAEGRSQARRIGAWFEAQGLKPTAVRSSLWCRCRETATEAFGRHSPWPALNSSFGRPEAQPAQTRLLEQALERLPGTGFEVWITHQVNMTALTGAYPAMGEGFALSREGRLLARLAWT